jgi:hypothetical protein
VIRIDRYPNDHARGDDPGLSHTYLAVIMSDAIGGCRDVHSDHNAAGFIMRVEVDWVMRHQPGTNPVMTIKPLTAGRLLPVAGLAFVWSAIRADMVTVDCTG